MNHDLASEGLAANVRSRNQSHRLTETPAHLASGLLCLLIGMSALSGCTTGRNGSNGANIKTNWNSLRYALTTEPTTLDPALVEDGTTIDLLQNIFEGLVIFDENNQIKPGIAEKWEISPDGMTYTFTIRRGVKFHNGREVTAEDFKYSLERACDPALKSPTAPTYLKDIVGATDRIQGKEGVTEVSGVKVLDKYTLQITIDAFKPYWLGNMAQPDGYVVCKEAIEKNGGKFDETTAIGAGPFKMAEFRRGYEVILEANPDYHFGRPKLDYIVRPILKDETTRMNNYEAGKLDIVDVTPRDLDTIQKNPQLKSELKAFPRAAIWYLALNSAAPDSPFGNVKTRQAFAMALDKKQIIQVALKGQADVANGIVPPGIANYKSIVKPLPYDPSRARQLLAEAGYPGGKNFPTLTLSYRNDYPQVADTGVVIASQLKSNLGVTIQQRPLEWGQFLTERTKKTMPLSHLRWAADYLDPQDFLSTLLHSSKLVNGQEDHPENGVGYNNPQFDKLCDEADVEHDPQKRMQLYQQAEQIAVNEAPFVPLYFQKDLELVKPRVGHLRDSLFGHLPFTTTTVKP